MIKCEVIGFEKLNSSNGDFYKVHAVSKDPIPKGSGFAVYSEFVDASHLKKHNVTEETLIGRECQHYSVKDGNRWKSGLTFK